MEEEKRDSISDLALLVNEMNTVFAETFYLDVGSELWESVELGFDCPPVEMMLPAGG